MAVVKGYVTVYESSDGGTGNPAKTFWQLFVNNQPVSIDNHLMADTVRLAISNNGIACRSLLMTAPATQCLRRALN